MGERNVQPLLEMATTSTAITTITQPLLEEPENAQVAVIKLRPPKNRNKKKVVWTEDTVDNEHMNKKKSKCCCIYEKPHKFGESDSEDSDDECEHCFGHVERRKQHQHQHQEDRATVQVVEEPVVEAEPTASLVLHPPTEPGSASEPPDVGKDEQVNGQ